MDKKETNLYSMTGLTQDEVTLCQDVLKSLKDKSMATEIEKELYINLKKAESFISTYGAWDDYLQYLMKDQELYAKAEVGV